MRTPTGAILPRRTLGITVADLAFYTSREPLSLELLGLADTGADRGPRAVVLRWKAAIADRTGGDLPAVGRFAPGILSDGRIRPRRRGAGRYCCGACDICSGEGRWRASAYFAVTLSPVLGFIDFGYMQFCFVADRFQYLAGIGVMAVLVGGAARGASRLPDAAPARMRAGAFVAVLAVLGTLTWQQAGIYKERIHVLRPHRLPQSRGSGCPPQSRWCAVRRRPLRGRPRREPRRGRAATGRPRCARQSRPRDAAHGPFRRGRTSISPEPSSSTPATGSPGRTWRSCTASRGDTTRRSSGSPRCLRDDASNRPRPGRARCSPCTSWNDTGTGHSMRWTGRSNWHRRLARTLHAPCPGRAVRCSTSADTTRRDGTFCGLPKPAPADVTPLIELWRLRVDTGTVRRSERESPPGAGNFARRKRRDNPDHRRSVAKAWDATKRPSSRTARSSTSIPRSQWLMPGWVMRCSVWSATKRSHRIPGSIGGRCIHIRQRLPPA